MHSQTEFNNIQTESQEVFDIEQAEKTALQKEPEAYNIKNIDQRLQDFIQIIARHDQIDQNMITASLYNALSAICYKYAVKFPKCDKVEDRYTNLSLYTLCLADTGERKSTIKKILTSILNEVQKTQREEWDNLYSSKDTAHKEALEFVESKQFLKQLKDKGFAERQQIKKEYLEQYPEVELNRPNWILNADITMEALKKRICEQNHIILTAGEFSILYNIIKGKYSKQLDATLLLDAFVSDDIRATRVHESEECTNPRLNLLTFWQGESFNLAKREKEFKELLGAGFWQRFNYILAKNIKRNTIPDTAPDILNSEIEKVTKEITKLFKDIDSVNKPKNKEELEKFTFLNFDQNTFEIIKWFCDNTEDQGTLQKIFSNNGLDTGFLTRAKDRLFKYAGLNHIVKYPKAPQAHKIEEDCVNNAIEFVKAEISHLERIFEQTESNDIIKGAFHILRYLQEKKIALFDRRKIQATLSRVSYFKGKTGNFKESIAYLLEAGYIDTALKEKTKGSQFTINIKLF